MTCKDGVLASVEISEQNKVSIAILEIVLVGNVARLLRMDST